MEGLKSGVVLCKVANLVKPGVIASKKIKVPSPAASPATTAADAATTSTSMSSSSLGAFGAMDNVAEFRNACKLIGVKEQVSSSSSLLSVFLSSENGGVMNVSAWIDLPFLFSFGLFCVCCGVGYLLGE